MIGALKDADMLDDNDKKDIERMIDLVTRRGYEKRVGDTPNDALQLIPKKYLGQAFTTDQRPASIKGALTVMFFNSTTGYPWFYNPNSSVWVNGAGSTVGSN